MTEDIQNILSEKVGSIKDLKAINGGGNKGSMVI